MGTLGCINDMLQRDKESRELRILSKERLKETRNRLMKIGSSTKLPDTSVEEMKEIRKKTIEKEKADANMDSFLSFYIGITYLSYCIRDNTLKEKELGAVSPYLFFLLLSYCLTAIIQHLKNKNYDLSGS